MSIHYESCQFLQSTLDNFYTQEWRAYFGWRGYYDLDDVFEFARHLRYRGLQVPRTIAHRLCNAIAYDRSARGDFSDENEEGSYQATETLEVKRAARRRMDLDLLLSARRSRIMHLPPLVHALPAEEGRCGRARIVSSRILEDLFIRPLPRPRARFGDRNEEARRRRR